MPGKCLFLTHARNVPISVHVERAENEQFQVNAENNTTIAHAQFEQKLHSLWFPTHRYGKLQKLELFWLTKKIENQYMWRGTKKPG